MLLDTLIEELNNGKIVVVAKEVVFKPYKKSHSVTKLAYYIKYSNGDMQRMQKRVILPWLKPDFKIVK